MKGTTVECRTLQALEPELVKVTIKVPGSEQTLIASKHIAAFSQKSLTRIVKGSYKQAVLDEAYCYSGLRKFLTKLTEIGFSGRVLLALAGRRNMATTQRYIYLRPSVLQNVIELL